jgi:hypothetical protein
VIFVAQKSVFSARVCGLILQSLERFSFEMKIEVGKFYKTRNSRKARIYATDGGSQNCQIHGAILVPGSGWLSTSWSNGVHNAVAHVRDDDLVSEWEDPKPRLLAWLNGSVLIGGNRILNFLPEDTMPGGIDWIRAPWLDQPKADK